jgi:hypothetical protein
MAPRILVCGALHGGTHLDQTIDPSKTGDIVWAHEEVKDMFDNSAEVIVSASFF